MKGSWVAMAEEGRSMHSFESMRRGILLFFLIVTIIGTVSAIPSLPCEIRGTVTINGDPAPVGAVITAMTGGEEGASITVKVPGVFGDSGPFGERLIISPDEDSIGSEIRFLVHGYPAEEFVLFGSGESLRIPITRTGLTGDLNGNGRVDIGDVSHVAWMAVGLAGEELRADFDYDSMVTAADAARIAYCYVGKIPAI